MPLFKHIKIDHRNSIIVWDITESISFFDDIQYDFGKMSLGRLKEKKCTHHILKHFYGVNKLNYSNNGKPYLDSKGKYVSISHSENRLAVGVFDNLAGIDIEYIAERASRVREKFAHKLEFKKPIELLDNIFWTLVWSVKESVFKKYADKEHLVFSSQIRIVFIDFKLNELTVEVNFSDGTCCVEKLVFLTLNSFILTYTC